MTHLGLFEGIGGFSLAAKWMGWDTLAWCEINEFCQKVLKYHFPKAEGFGDIKESNFTKYANKVDILTGGFPCQPFSNSGEQQGISDPRWLFDEMLRAIQQIKPQWIVAENVFALTSQKFSKTFEYISSSMENEGYEVLPIIIPATAVEAEHERYRIWFIAYAERFGLPRSGTSIRCLQPTKIGNRETNRFVNSIQGNSMPFVCKSHNGISRKLAEFSLQGIGNAIVPQIAFEIFKSIDDINKLFKSNS